MRLEGSNLRRTALKFKNDELGNGRKTEHLGAFGSLKTNKITVL